METCYFCKNSMKQCETENENEEKEVMFYCETCAENVQFCYVCKEYGIYMDWDYDAYFCAKCDEWQEEKCGDIDCDYCPGRPMFPSQTKKHSS